MDVTAFWSLIDTARKDSDGNQSTQFELLVSTLSQLPEKEIIEFDRILWEMMARAYRANLWEAAYTIACGCSDDGFHEFCGWLIAQGQTIFEAALEDPESLADVIAVERRFDVEDGRMTTVAADAYELLTGQEMPEYGYREPLVLVGELGNEEEIPAKFPRIIAKLGSCEEWAQVYGYQ